MAAEEGAVSGGDGRRRAILAGHRGDEATARSLDDDDDPDVRAAALSALVRLGAATAADIRRGLGDGDPKVRQRACEVAATVQGLDDEEFLPLLSDSDAAVVETAAWAMGERGEGRSGAAVAALAKVAGEHAEPLCREAAVAALGAIGDPAGLAAVLAGTEDRPAVRRRAVIALAAFEGPDVEAALLRAKQDRDWQVRQAAEDLS